MRYRKKMEAINKIKKCGCIVTEFSNGTTAINKFCEFHKEQDKKGEKIYLKSLGLIEDILNKEV